MVCLDLQHTGASVDKFITKGEKFGLLVRGRGWWYIIRSGTGRSRGSSS